MPEKKLPALQKFIYDKIWTPKSQRSILDRPSVSLSDPAILELLGGGEVSGTGVVVNTENSLSVTALWNAITLISGHIATFPLGVFQITDNGKGRERLRNHPVDILLSRDPNPLMTAFDWKRIMKVTALLNGNSFAWIHRNNSGVPIELEYLDTNIEDTQVVLMRTTDGAIIYRYTRIIDKQQIVDDIEAANMLHIKGLTLNGIWGMDVISFHKNTIGLSLAQTQHNSDMFKNGAKLEGIIEGATTKQQVKQVKSTFSRTHVGVGKQFGTAVLPNGLTYKSISISPRDMEMNVSIRMTVEDVARIFNIPIHKLKNLDRATNNNIEHQGLEYFQDCLLPWVTGDEQEYNRKLLKESEKANHFTKHNMTSILRADTKTRFESYAIGKQNKLYTTNEIRAKEDDNPIAGGDILENPNIDTNEANQESD